MKDEKQERTYGFDYTLLITILFLVSFGLIMLYSVSYYIGESKFGDGLYFFNSQFRFAVLGLMAMIFIVRIPYSMYGGWRAWAVYWFAMVLMAMVKTTPLGVELNGASRWLDLPGLGTFQPSEVMKIGIIAVTPTIVYKLKLVQLDLESMKEVLWPGILAALMIFLGTDNLSTAIVIFGINAGVTLLLAGHSYKILAIITGMGFSIGMLIQLYGEALFSKMGGFRMSRLLVWLDPASYADTGGYQVMQGLYAIGSGGLFGKGLGNGTQKISSIPEVQNDMIFAAICEELGVFGLIILLFLFGILLYRLFVIAQNAPCLHSSLIVAGIFIHIALQVIINLGVVTALLPNTGVTLPFISYGGTALLILLCEMGIALGISRQ